MRNYYFQITPSGVYDVIYLFFLTTALLNSSIMWHTTDENTKNYVPFTTVLGKCTMLFEYLIILTLKKNVHLKICDAQLQSFKTYCWGNEVPVEQSTPV